VVSSPLFTASIPQVQALFEEVKFDQGKRAHILTQFKKYISLSNHDVMIMKKPELDRFLGEHALGDKRHLQRNDLCYLMSGGHNFVTIDQFQLLVTLLDFDTPHNITGASGQLRLSLIFKYFDLRFKGFLSHDDIQRLFSDLQSVDHPDEAMPAPAKAFLELTQMSQMRLVDFYKAVCEKSVRGTSQLLRIQSVFRSEASASMSTLSPRARAGAPPGVPPPPAMRPPPTQMVLGPAPKPAPIAPAKTRGRTSSAGSLVAVEEAPGEEDTDVGPAQPLVASAPLPVTTAKEPEPEVLAKVEPVPPPDRPKSPPPVETEQVQLDAASPATKKPPGCCGVFAGRPR